MSKPVEAIVKRLKAHAETGVWDGRRQTVYFERGRYFDRHRGWTVMFTRDVGYHSSGWWKNPDYERCYHLSLSFRDPETNEPRPRDTIITGEFLDAFFGRPKRFIWSEPPYSDDGKRLDVWHYRLFCDPGWQPIKPRGEVYDKDLAERGWLSWSDAQAALRLETDRAVEILKNI